MSRSIHKNLVIIVWCLTCMGLPAYTQTLKDHLSRGDRFYEKKDYDNALTSYLEALQLDAGNAETNFKVGVSYLHREKVSKAVIYLEKAFNINPDVDPGIDYHLGKAYQFNHQYSKASDHYAAFKIKNKKLANIADQKIIECSIADSLFRLPANAEIHSLGPEINTRFTEFWPLVSSDGKTLIFTTNRSSNNYQIKSATNLEDVYVSRKTGDQWGPPQKLSPNINIKSNDAAASLSHDGKTLFLYYETGKGDIYTATLQNGEWTVPVALNKFVNNPQYRETSACVSPDGKKLYFASNRPGGKGGYDIYVSELTQNGQWGRPANLGSTINTRLDEDSPFMHADGVTLYFSSNGHPTLGDNDIFKSELKDGKWTLPENLGYPINSSKYDGFFSLSEDKKTGYFSALREDGPGNTDIYAVTFPEPEQPVILASATEGSADFIDPMIQVQREKKVVTKLSGKVIDVSSAAPLSATIRLVDNTNNRTISRISTDESGNFELIIPHGGNYGIRTEKKGYLFNSINYNLPPFEEYQEVDTQILMAKAEVGSIVVLKNVFFDVSQSDLKVESMAELENIRDLLLQNSQLIIQINGHTDNTGDAATNRALSLKRAESVIAYLIKQGVEPRRLLAKGYGSERPLVSNDDEAGGRQINRRTEIEIIGLGE